MATMVDGLGFEELGGPGDPGSRALGQLWLTGSIITQSDLQVAGTVSGAGTVQCASISGTNANMTGSLFDGNAQVRSVSIGSPQTYGARIQAGSCVTNAGSYGVVIFGTPFANAEWACTLIPSSGINAGGGAGSGAWFSGVKAASHGSFVGAPSVTYDWIAVGL